MPKTIDPLVRFEPKFRIDHETGCWVWVAGRFTTGYGAFHYGVKMMQAHRVAYMLLVGPIPKGLQLDHLCRNRACVNPDHLEPVTCAENLLRGDAPSMIAWRSGLCLRGHEMSVTDSGRRVCHTCQNEHRRRRYREQVGRPVRKYRIRADTVC